MLIRRLATAAALAVAASTATVLATAAPAAAAGTPVTNPPALWVKLDGTPTSTEAAYAAAHYRVVILNPWETTTLQRIKAANPAVTVLAYKCLSSTRSYSGAVDGGKDAAILPTGVGYVEASSHPEWFALDTAGNRVSWGPYPGHWQMSVWDSAYQQRWAANVTNEIVANGWDGVFADNALTTLKWYSRATLAAAPTNAALQAGERGLIAAAGAALKAKGKLLVPNIGESRLYTGLWSDWTSLASGGMEESFAHMDSDPSTGFIGDWGGSGYTAQAAEVAAPGLNLAVTRYLPGDRRSYLYGLSMFYVNGGGRGAFTATSDYGVQPLQTEQTWDLGAPLSGVVKAGTAYTRAFANGWAATNPSETQTTTVTAPAGATDATGATVTSVTLAPHTGTVLKVAAATTTPTTTTVTNGKKKFRHFTAPVAGTTTAAPGGSAPKPAALPAAVRNAAVPAPRRTAVAVRVPAGARAAAARVTAVPAVAAPAVPVAAPAAAGAALATTATAARATRPAGPVAAALRVAGPAVAAVGAAGTGSRTPDAVLLLPLLAVALARPRRAVRAR
ncbi:MAG TPA: putative glycoside hydrolase [Mycobacteriales bacterium]|nr:putative glycoside hydrolase [Mycobacteriales bacterium]